MFKKFLSLSLIALSFAACTEDVMDDINKDEANPAVDIVDAGSGEGSGVSMDAALCGQEADGHTRMELRRLYDYIHDDKLSRPVQGWSSRWPSD